MEVGITTSGASVGLVPIQFYKKAENLALEEQLVIIHDQTMDDELLLGVIRNVTKLEPLIRDRVRSPFVDRPEVLDQTILMPFTSAMVRLYAALKPSTKSVLEVRHVPTPGSKVFVIKDGRFLNDYVKSNLPINVGSHKYSGWPISLDAGFVNQHVGVFGATGVGKSRLVKALIEELIRVGKHIIIFDHSGVDYAPYFKDRVITSKEIAISPPTIASVIAEKARLNWQTFGEYLEVAVITYVSGDKKIKRQQSSQLIDSQISNQVSQVIKWDKAAFTKHLVDSMRGLGARDSTVEKARLFIDYFIENEFFDELNKRALLPMNIVNRALNSNLVVIDLSLDPELVVKQAIIADVIDAAWKLVKTNKSPLDLAFIIDEAQNYVPENEWTICGDVIETTAREGRKWGLSLIVASQRIARDIRASIRANLGTVFFSRLSAQGDLREIAAYMDLADVNEATLAQLGTREFFVAGLMNPLRKPILIRVRDA
ncbi:AAA ATPase [Vulcanisaeta moutnovskia 768-28]|uniref:AAA ATPase n=1 Tax=Vulcanisaeta moutnovskia (strain 768-28) TaxID=985053 RepID=F0QX41_VULM7|nr:ATP-binding protein [Vulcanisaeta moutnovskia]ADY02330.1 AAA ATPase [Vulcanisaeta moutnovskia 768-28]